MMLVMCKFRIWGKWGGCLFVGVDVIVIFVVVVFVFLVGGYSLVDL